MKIELGSVCIEIQCQDPELTERMLSSYRPFLVSREPDFRIKLNLRNKLTPTEVKSLLANARSHLEDNGFVTRPELLECRIDWPSATLRVDTERELFSPVVDYKLMNLLMRGIYSGIYSKLKKAALDAYLVHGCGIVADKNCYLFTGPSGSGKSTVAGLSDGRKVLNDETVLIGRSNGGFNLAGTPFDGGTPRKCNSSSVLSSIFFLRHDTRVSLRKLNKVETYTRLLAQIFDTSPLFEIPGDDSMQERADLSAEIAVKVPSYELGFRPDGSFWQTIESL